MPEINATLDAFLKAVIAVSTASGAIAIFAGKRSDTKKEAAQRKREADKAEKEEEKARALVERDNEVARILRERDEKLAAAAEQVRLQTKIAAEKVEQVRLEQELAKEEVAHHRIEEKKAFNGLQDKVDATHVIVNAQKTAMMRKLADSQLFTLTLAQAMFEEKPHSQKLKMAVASAQALYDASMRDLAKKEEE